MKTKRLLCPQRLRTVPHQFSWIDQRLVREGHIARCGGTQALALYLLLVTVADGQGLSFYSDKTAARLLCISETLAFAPGECAQVDWGCAGSMAVGSTRRRLSFFVMVLCYSRLCYLEFSLGEATEHFLSAHQNAFQFLGGVPLKVLIDNPKTAVLKHPSGEKPLFHPRYLDFAAHYGFEPRACNVRRPNEKALNSYCTS
jgi:Integrase core domain